jgi:hypothetical protein
MGFLKANAGKLGLAAVLLVAAIGLYFFWVGRSVESRIGDTLTYVCVETGETFTFPRAKARIPPLENPKTGRRTLLACYERDGKLFVRSRERALLGQLGTLNKVVDTETLQVTLPP